MVFQCKHLILIVLYMICGPRAEYFSQSPIHFEHSSSREDENPKASQILEVCKAVLRRSILVESASLLTTAPQGIHRALTLLDPGLDDELFVLLQRIRDGQQVVIDLGFKRPVTRRISGSSWKYSSLSRSSMVRMASAKCARNFAFYRLGRRDVEIESPVSCVPTLVDALFDFGRVMPLRKSTLKIFLAERLK